MNPMITPIPNLNGNSEESLIDQLRGVMSAVVALQKAIGAASDCWHGRNFQTLPDGQLAQRDAMSAWMDRSDWLGSFHNEVLTMALEIQGHKHAIVPRGWDKVEGGPIPAGPWHTASGDNDEVFVEIGDRHVFVINEGPLDARMRTANDLVDRLNRMTAELVLPTLHDKHNDTQSLGVVMNETHAEGDDAPLGPKTGGK